MNDILLYSIGGVVLLVIIVTIVRMSLSKSNHSGGILSQGLVLLLLVLLLTTLGSVLENSRSTSQIVNHDYESFSNFDWGYAGEEQHPWNPEHTESIVGPDPNSTELKTWQYHPDNTQVDYRYYRKYDCIDPNAPKDMQRLAPVTRASVGIRNEEPIHVNDNLGTVSTRVPDNNSNASEYVVQSPATNVPIAQPTPDYKW